MDQKLEKLIKSLELIEKQTVVLHEKQANIENLLKLGGITDETRSILSQNFTNFQHKLEELKKTYDNVKKRCELQQLQMLYLLEKMDAKQISKMGMKKGFQPTDSLNVPLEMQKKADPKTPLRMRVTDYETSPYVSRRQPIQLQFLDFGAHITPEEFATVPSYMKGRETLDDLRAFLDQIVISCFNEKYTLSCKKRDAIRNQHDIEIWKIYRQQKDDFPGKYFVTEGDIARKIGRLVDKKMLQKMQMLRHLNVIKEVRKVKTVYYIWNLQ